MASCGSHLIWYVKQIENTLIRMHICCRCPHQMSYSHACKTLLLMALPFSSLPAQLLDIVEFMYAELRMYEQS